MKRPDFKKTTLFWVGLALLALGLFNKHAFAQLSSQYKLSALNPTASNNPAGVGYPGLRGNQQLVVYTPFLGRATTETNEFGHEVTVQNGRIVESEGSNSRILLHPAGGYILSGHGQARVWLQQHGSVGSRVILLPKAVEIIQDKETAKRQLEAQMALMTGSLGSLAPQLQHYFEAWPDMTDEKALEQAGPILKQMEALYWKTVPPLPEKTMRAVWIRPSMKSEAEIDAMLDKLQATGIQTLFLETYLHGDPIFESRTFQRYHIPQTPPFTLANDPDKRVPDLLKLWIDKAHLRGMKLHVWFQTFYAGHQSLPDKQGEILTTYPEWANIQRRSAQASSPQPSNVEQGYYFLDPGNPEVQNFLLSFIGEIAERYAIDGFQLDYIRYPAVSIQEKPEPLQSTWGYSDKARELFMREFHQDPLRLTLSSKEWPAWQAYKTRQVSLFVQKASMLIKMKRPNTLVSAAIFPKKEESLKQKHQDWATWAEKNWVDALAPMTLTSSVKVIQEDTARLKALNIPIYTGIFGPLNRSTPTALIQQVMAARQADGVILFEANGLTPQMHQALGESLFKHRN
jgi:uncharacterized lipoprotein YddW (UPF0748 family)